jgi:ribonuclease HI
MAMTSETSGWTRMKFKNNKVWVAVNSDGNILSQNGKTLIRYQKNQDYEYWVNTTNLIPLEETSGHIESLNTVQNTGKIRKEKLKIRDSSDLSEDPNCIHIYADGASSGNPGPSGIGVFFRYREHEKAISRNIGMGTNNIAELEAIRTGLLEVKNPDLPVRLYTDSGYAYGLLVLGWKAKKNVELVEEIRTLMKRFKNLKFIKVKGHSGIDGNEKADVLATSAIKLKK